MKRFEKELECEHVKASDLLLTPYNDKVQENVNAHIRQSTTQTHDLRWEECEDRLEWARTTAKDSVLTTCNEKSAATA